MIDSPPRRGRTGASVPDRRPAGAVSPALLALPILLALLVGATGAPAAVPDELAEVPRPVLDNLEAAAREQIVEERGKLDALLEAGAREAELAAAFGGMGRLYYLNDFTAAAEACFVNAVRLEPDEFRWHYFLGALYPAAGRVEEAEASLERALELRGDYLPAWIRLGRAQLRLGRLEAAAESFGRALELEPASAAAEHGLGQVAFERGDFAAAIRHFQRTLELQPAADQTHYQLGLAYRELGERELALEHLKQNRQSAVVFEDPLIDNLYQLVGSAKLHFDSAIELLRQSRPELAIEQLRMAIEKRPDQFMYHHNLAGALAVVGEKDEAIAEYRRVLELNPGYPNAHFNLAMMLVERGEIEEAALHLEQAHRNDPGDLVAHLEWATALSQLGRPEEAALELGRVLDKDPGNGQALLNLATVQAQLGRPAAAVATLQELLGGDATPEEASQAWVQLGRLAEQGGDLGRAVAAYRSALAADEASRGARLALARGLARQGSYSEAAIHFGHAVGLDPSDPEAHFGRALSLMLSESYGAAREALEESVARHPANAPLVHLLARLLAAAPDDAVRDGDRGLELARQVFERQQTIDHAETVAMALAELGRFDEAAEWQRGVVARAEQARGPAAAAGPRRRLELYEGGRACRAPWIDG